MRSNRRRWEEPRVTVSLSGGPSYSRDAEEDDQPYVRPTIRLGFTSTARREVEPLLWDGDNA